MNEKIINPKIEKYYKYAKVSDRYPIYCAKTCCKINVCNKPCRCCNQWYNMNLDENEINYIIKGYEDKLGFYIFMDEFCQINEGVK